VQHDAGGFLGYFFGLKGREAAGYFVGTDKLAAIEHLGQQGEGGHGFARPIAARDEVEDFSGMKSTSKTTTSQLATCCKITAAFALGGACG
jgi:hypothetical protein